MAALGGGLGAPVLWPAHGSLSFSSKRKLGPACLQSCCSATGLFRVCHHFFYPSLSLKLGLACLQEVCLQPLVAMPIPQTERVAAVRHLPAAAALQLLQYLAKLVQLHAGKAFVCALCCFCPFQHSQCYCFGVLWPPWRQLRVVLHPLLRLVRSPLSFCAVALSLWIDLSCVILASSQPLQQDSLSNATCLCCCREMPVDTYVWAAASAECRPLTSDTRT